MREFIEMEDTSNSLESGRSSYSKTGPSPVLPPLNGYVEKAVKKEYELRPNKDRSISHLWVFLPIVFYLTAVVGGLMTSISVGNVYAAFDNYCILNGNFTLKDNSSIKSRKLGVNDFKSVSWGSKFECEFTAYASVACVLYAGVWIVMVLQCGRGGASKRGFRLPDAWRIVPPTCLGNLIVLIISSVILDQVTNGFSSFCDNILSQKQFAKNATCIDALGYKFYWDKYNTNLVQEYEMSHVGAIVQFVGCLLGFCIVSLRCCLAPDFEVYERTLRGYVPAQTEDPEDEEEDLFNSCNSEPMDFGPMVKTTSVDCHNPGLLMDPDDQDFLDSLGSHKELLISKT